MTAADRLQDGAHARGRARRGASLAALATLLRWLGPWAGDGAPASVRRTTLTIPGPRAVRAHRYAPSRRPVWGGYLIAPGLHFFGPDDPRLDRFCRVLAASGLLVLAPFLPDHVRLRVSPRVADDLGAAWDCLAAEAAEQRLPPPSIFSISFGSQPTLALAAQPSHRDRVGPLVLFGGFADFHAAVRFAITGIVRHGGEERALPRDPLNSPAVFLNMLPYLGLGDDDRASLEAAWHEMVSRTWGRMELKRPGARDPFAAAIAAGLPPALRELFLTGCGLRPGAAEMLEGALRAAGSDFDFTDPRPSLARLRAPVVIAHGRGDDVIPWIEAEKLGAALPAGHPHRVLLTGMFDHTGAAALDARAIAREIRTTLSLVRAMADAPRGIVRAGGG